MQQKADLCLWKHVNKSCGDMILDLGMRNEGYA